MSPFPVLAEMAESKAYKMTTNKILQFGIMVENASKMTSQAQKDALKDVAEVLMKSDKTAVSKKQLVVTTRTVGKDHPFTFASVHHDLPLPDIVEQVPLVVEGCKSLNQFKQVKRISDFVTISPTDWKSQDTFNKIIKTLQ